MRLFRFRRMRRPGACLPRLLLLKGGSPQRVYARTWQEGGASPMIIDVLANRSLNFTVFAYRNTSPYLLRPPLGADTYDWYDIDKLAHNFNRSVGSSAV